jgi:nitrogenase-associated protein
MATINFYEKPGCIGNGKQKRRLQGVGHRLRVHNLLTEPWTAARLRPFFGDRPVEIWFNPTAPPIKAGQVSPAEVSAAAALALMVADPILIRRPLMQVGDRCVAGFDPVEIDAWIGLAPDSDLTQDLQTCPRTV